MQNLTFRKTTTQDVDQLNKIDQHFSHHENRHLHSISLGTHFSARD